MIAPFSNLYDRAAAVKIEFAAAALFLEIRFVLNFCCTIVVSVNSCIYAIGPVNMVGPISRSIICLQIVCNSGSQSAVKVSKIIYIPVTVQIMRIAVLIQSVICNVVVCKGVVISSSVSISSSVPVAVASFVRSYYNSDSSVTSAIIYLFD